MIQIQWAFSEPVDCQSHCHCGRRQGSTGSAEHGRLSGCLWLQLPGGLWAHALVLTFLEESRLRWENLFAVQKVRENISYRSHAPVYLSVPMNYTATNGMSNPGSRPRLSKVVRRRTCNKLSMVPVHMNTLMITLVIVFMVTIVAVVLQRAHNSITQN